MNNTDLDFDDDTLSQVSAQMSTQDMRCPILMTKYDAENYPVTLHCGHTLSIQAFNSIKVSSNKCPTCKVTFLEGYIPKKALPFANIAQQVNEKRKRISCHYHPQQKAIYLCLEHDEPLCDECVIDSNHKDHKKIVLRKLAAEVNLEKQGVEECMKYLAYDLDCCRGDKVDQNTLDLLILYKEQRKTMLQYINKKYKDFDVTQFESECDIKLPTSSESKLYIVKSSNFINMIRKGDLQRARAFVLNSKNKKELVNSKTTFTVKNNENEFGEASSLHQAVLSKCIEIIQLLVENGADLNKGWMQSATEETFVQSPLEAAELIGHLEIKNYLQSKLSSE